MRSVVALAMLLLPAAAWGQAPVPAAPRVEARVGSELSPLAAPFAGIGVSARAGWYARLGVAAEGGAVHAHGAWRATGRLSASARFLLDPFGDRRVGLYGGAGLGLSFAERRAGQGALFLVLGAEGDAHRRRLVPALEVRLGGGVHATLVLRARRADSR